PPVGRGGACRQQRARRAVRPLAAAYRLYSSSGAPAGGSYAYHLAATALRAGVDCALWGGAPRRASSCAVGSSAFSGGARSCTVSLPVSAASVAPIVSTTRGSAALGNATCPQAPCCASCCASCCALLLRALLLLLLLLLPLSAVACDHSEAG